MDSRKMDINNIWGNDTDTDSEYDDEEYPQNEVPPPDINKEFRDTILKVKHTLYDKTVLAPELGTKEAQSNKVLQDYLNNLNSLYVMTINAQTGKIIGNEQTIKNFPPETQEVITSTLQWIADFFNKNTASDTIPYSDFLHNTLHVYPFVQDNSFEWE